MKLKISYNKDKSRMFATIAVPRARLAREERLYNTLHVVQKLNDMGIKVSIDDCVKGTKVFNYASPEQRTGTWTFLAPKTEKTKQEPEQPQVATPQVATPQATEPKPAPKLRPRRDPTSRRPSPRRPERKDVTRRKNPKRN